MAKWLKKYFPVLILLFFAWLIFAERISFSVAFVGIFVSLVTLYLLPIRFLRHFAQSIVFRALFVLAFLFYLFLEVFQASYQIAFFSLWPGVSLETSVIGYSYSVENKVALFLLSTVITLTPGTLVLEISRKRNRLYIHHLTHAGAGRKDTWETIKLMENWLRRIFE